MGLHDLADVFKILTDKVFHVMSQASLSNDVGRDDTQVRVV